jgi:hypothetical protein
MSYKKLILCFLLVNCGDGELENVSLKNTTCSENIYFNGIDTPSNKGKKCNILSNDLVISIKSESGYHALNQNMNLNLLENIHTIEGSLIIKNDSSLLDLHGLEGLKRIGGDLIISNVLNLASLNGLNNLGSVLGNFHITNNKELKNINDLDSLDYVGEKFLILSNKELKNIDDMKKRFPEIIFH